MTQIPLPLIDEFNREYWGGCKRHELQVQKCSDCGRLRFPPQPMCGHCTSVNADWIKLSGRGQLYTWTTVHPPVLPAFQDKTPYNVIMVQLDEGIRMISNLVDCENDQIEIGMPVEVLFEEVTDDVTLPKFRPAR